MEERLNNLKVYVATLETNCRTSETRNSASSFIPGPEGVLHLNEDMDDIEKLYQWPNGETHFSPDNNYPENYGFLGMLHETYNEVKKEWLVYISNFLS